MSSHRSLRAIMGLAGVALAALLLFLLLHRPAHAPDPQPGNDFDPADFVRGRPQLDAPYIASDLQAVDAMLGLAQVRPNDNVIDLGSGDGRILISAARSLGAHGLGVDIDPARIRESTANAQQAGVSGRVTFRQQNLFETPLGDADVLTLYLLPEVNVRLRPRILGQMRPGARVVSHDFDMGDWHWDQRQRVGNATIYLWIVPARIGNQVQATLVVHHDVGAEPEPSQQGRQIVSVEQLAVVRTHPDDAAQGDAIAVPTGDLVAP